MITFSFENGAVITLRTSGTEPKIKYYAEMCASSNEKYEFLFIMNMLYTSIKFVLFKTFPEIGWDCKQLY